MTGQRSRASFWSAVCKDKPSNPEPLFSVRRDPPYAHPPFVMLTFIPLNTDRYRSHASLSRNSVPKILEALSGVSIPSVISLTTVENPNYPALAPEFLPTNPISRGENIMRTSLLSLNLVP